MANVERNSLPRHVGDIPLRGKIKNLPASVKARLFNYAKDNGKDFQGVFRLYVQERFLYRLSKSAYAKKFIPKGVLLFLAFDISNCRKV